MTPVFAMNDAIDRCRSNAVFSGKVDLAFSLSESAAYFTHLLGSKFGFVGTFTARLATLRYLIRYVVGLSTQKRMVGVAAKRIVKSIGAIVTDQQSIRNRAEMEFIAEAMGANPVIVYAQCPIPRYGIAPPEPTLGKGARSNVLPKSFFGGEPADTVPKDEAHRLTLDVSQLSKRSFGDRRWQTTSALTEFGDCGRKSFAASMPEYKAVRLSLEAFAFCVRSCGDGRFLPTTAMAVTVWDFVRGMIHDVTRSFQRLTMPAGVSQTSRWRFHWGATGVIIAQMEM